MTASALFVAALPFFYLLFVASVTPGPNNVMLTASGMNFGYQKTIPHIVGIIVGFLILMLLCAYGVGEIYKAYPPVEIALKVLGVTYLLYLSWRILTAGRVGLKEKAEKAVRPLTFLEATGFQFINPKGVIFGLAAVNLLPAGLTLMQTSVVIFISVMICSIVSTHVWVLFGKMVATLFRDDKTRRIINIVLAVMLVASIPMMLF